MDDLNLRRDGLGGAVVLVAFLGACSSMTPPGDAVADSTLACPPLPVGCRTCETAGDCDQGQGQLCITGCCTTGPCISLGCGSDCLNEMDCIDGDVCDVANGSCATPLPDVSCRSSADCPCDARCVASNGGVCAARYFFCEANCPAGVPCSDNDRCTSGHCVGPAQDADGTCQ
jgi:hypothetical protein